MPRLDKKEIDVSHKVKTDFKKNVKMYIQKDTYNFLRKEGLQPHTSISILMFPEDAVINKSDWIEIRIKKVI